MPHKSRRNETTVEPVVDGRELREQKGRLLVQSVIDLVPKTFLLSRHDGPTGTTVNKVEKVYLRTMPVAWGICLDDILFSKFFVNWLGIRAMPWDDMLTAYSTYLPDARNQVHERFVKDCQLEWLVMLDSDVLAPPDFLTRLLAHNKKMVGGWYRKKKDPYKPVVYSFDSLGTDGILYWKQYDKPRSGLERVDGAGAGCWLMHRDVAVALGERPYSMADGGEDLHLCHEVTKAGFEMFIDWDIACAHAGVAVA